MTELSPYWKATSSGAEFDFVAPTPAMIDIYSIAHELSRQPRWGGNIEPAHYSVAQHSVLVADAISRPEWRIYGLLHDAAEAYIGDIITPLKAMIEMGGFSIRALEARILSCVWTHFGLLPPRGAVAEAVDQADMRMAATEIRDVVLGRTSSLRLSAPPFPARIRPLGPIDAEAQFRERFHAYMELAR